MHHTLNSRGLAEKSKSKGGAPLTLDAKLADGKIKGLKKRDHTIK